jgi:glycosyltransferase involved in cell wall biosynthesis
LIEPLKNSISFCGLEKKIENKMILADYLLFPCQVGHFARPVIEAAFLKVPSIASKLSPLDELIIDSQTGFLLSHENTLEWANLILKLMLAPDQYQTINDQCFEFAINKFSLKNQIRKLTQVYSEVIKAGGTSS